MSRVIYISGGQRSGKSRFAQSKAESLSPQPYYLATAHCWDKEFTDRIQRHQADRGEQWTTVEEEIHIAQHDWTGRVVLMDCVTLWLTNIFAAQNYERDKALAFAKEEWARLIAQDVTLIVVSNEIGMGVIPMEASTRAFVDLQGWMNQHIATQAQEVYTLISGLALKLK